MEAAQSLGRILEGQSHMFTRNLPNAALCNNSYRFFLFFICVPSVSNSLRNYTVCSSFRIGPMSLEVKQRKSYVRAKRVKPTENDTPEEVRVVYLIGNFFKNI